MVSWLTELAKIMGLGRKECTELTKVIFFKNGVKDYLNQKETVEFLFNARGPDTVKAGVLFFKDRSVLLWGNNHHPQIISEVFHDGSAYFKFQTMRESMLPIYLDSQQNGGLPFHAALVEKEKTRAGILLVGPSGAGKSTCCQRFPEGWKPLGDDQALVVFNEQKGYLAHPFPSWGNYLNRRAINHSNAQTVLPLTAIFFIEQSESDGVFPIGKGRASALITCSAKEIFRSFWHKIGSTDRKRLRNNVFENACALAEKTPVFTLQTSLQGNFWEKIDQALSG